MRYNENTFSETIFIIFLSLLYLKKTLNFKIIQTKIYNNKNDYYHSFKTRSGTKLILLLIKVVIKG